MQEHTPGPWTLTQDQPNTLDVSKRADGIRSRLAQVHADMVAEEHGGDWKANARLMAAAPEMLEALQGVWACYRDDALILGSSYAKAIADAITNATGEYPA